MSTTTISKRNPTTTPISFFPTKKNRPCLCLVPWLLFVVFIWSTIFHNVVMGQQPATNTNPASLGFGEQRYYYRIRYTFFEQQPIVAPTEEEIAELKRVTSLFYQDYISETLPNTEVLGVRFLSDSVLYNPPTRQVEFVGTMYIAFDPALSIPAEELILTRLDGMDLIPYFTNYLFRMQPVTNIFRTTITIDTDFQIAQSFTTTLVIEPTPMPSVQPSFVNELSIFYYRIIYSFFQEEEADTTTTTDPPPPTGTEINALLELTSQFYIERLPTTITNTTTNNNEKDLFLNEIINNKIESIQFIRNETDYRTFDEEHQFLVHGSVLVTYYDDNEYRDFYNNNYNAFQDDLQSFVIGRLDGFDLLPYIREFLQPTFFFRTTRQVQTEFREQSPFPLPLPEITFYYRYLYTFFDEANIDGNPIREPTFEEVMSMLNTTSDFYRNYIPTLVFGNNNQRVQIHNVYYNIDERYYNPSPVVQDQYIIQGHVTFQFPIDSYIPKRDAFVDRLDDNDFNLVPYITDYLYQMEPEPTNNDNINIFTLTNMVTTSYRVEQPFEEPRIEPILETMFYVRHSYIFYDEGTTLADRPPTSAEMEALQRVSNDFYRNSISNQFSNATIDNVSLQITSMEFNTNNNECKIFGTFNISFVDDETTEDENKNDNAIPSRRTIFLYFDDINLNPYFSYLYSTDPETNIFRYTVRIDTAFRWPLNPNFDEDPTDTTSSATNDPNNNENNLNFGGGVPQPFADRMELTYYYRIRYNITLLLVDEDQEEYRVPTTDEINELHRVTDQFYLNSISSHILGNNNNNTMPNHNYHDNYVQSVTMESNIIDYNPINDQFTLQGRMNVTLHSDSNTFIDPPEIRVSIFNQLDNGFNFSSYPMEYILEIQPEDNFFRSTTGVDADFRLDDPFDELWKEITCYCRFVYTFDEGKGRQPTIEEITILLDAADEFFMDAIPDLYNTTTTTGSSGSSSVIETVDFRTSDAEMIYRASTEQFVMKGPVTITFRNTNNNLVLLPTASESSLCDRLNDLDLNRYLKDYLWDIQPPSNIFNSTTMVTLDSSNNKDIEIMFFFRLTYGLDEAYSREPNSLEVLELIGSTNQFYLISIDNVYMETQFEEVRLEVNATAYMSVGSQFVVVGKIHVIAANNSDIRSSITSSRSGFGFLPPTSEDVMSQFNNFDMDPYIMNYLLKIQPETNVFRSTIWVNAEFDLENPFQSSVPPQLPTASDENEENGTQGTRPTRSPSQSPGQTISIVSGPFMFYYRFNYTFLEGTGREPTLDEISTVVSVTNQFYIDSIPDKFANVGVENVNFEIDATNYNPFDKKIILQGAVTVTFLEDSSILPPRDEFINQFDEFDIRSYISLYLFQIQPETNIFREAGVVTTEARDEIPYDLPTTQQPQVEEDIVEISFYYRFNYTFIDGSGREPRLDEILNLFTVTSQFYVDFTPIYFRNAFVESVDFGIDATNYDSSNELFVIQGPVTVSFNSNRFVPPRDKFVNSFDKYDRQQYLINYVLNVETETNIFRYTEIVTKESRDNLPVGVVESTPITMIVSSVLKYWFIEDWGDGMLRDSSLNREPESGETEQILTATDNYFVKLLEAAYPNYAPITATSQSNSQIYREVSDWDSLVYNLTTVIAFPNESDPIPTSENVELAIQRINEGTPSGFIYLEASVYTGLLPQDYWYWTFASELSIQ